MKNLPFNACDYRCEHCLVTAECAVFKKLQERSLQRGVGGSDENDLVAALRDMRESFRETEGMIKRKAREFGIDIDELAGGITAAEIREEHRSIMEDPLYKRSHEFTMQTDRFLLAAGPAVADQAREYLDDIGWHHTVVTAKVYRALGWKMDGDVSLDARSSAAVAMNSLTICIMAFDYLASQYPAIGEECRRLSASGSQIKKRSRRGSTRTAGRETCCLPRSRKPSTPDLLEMLYCYHYWRLRLIICCL